MTAYPKTKAKRNPALLRMAEGRRCLLTAVHNCRGLDGSTTVACHSNQSQHGKGGARKADDCYTVWGCINCHQWLDQGKASKAEKARAFEAAHTRQIAEWRKLADSYTEQYANQQAALWALEQLEKSNGTS